MQTEPPGRKTSFSRLSDALPGRLSWQLLTGNCFSGADLLSLVLLRGWPSQLVLPLCSIVPFTCTLTLCQKSSQEGWGALKSKSRTTPECGTNSPERSTLPFWNVPRKEGGRIPEFSAESLYRREVEIATAFLSSLTMVRPCLKGGFVHGEFSQLEAQVLAIQVWQTTH